MKTVLVVDDEKSVTDSLSTMLHYRHKWNVVTANNGSDALKIAKSVMPDAIVLDILMPGMSGDVVAMRLREDSQTKHIPIIFLSGITGDKLEKLCHGLVGHFFFPKPAHHSEISQAIMVATGFSKCFSSYT